MLFFTVHLFVGAVTSGAALVLVLVLGYGTLTPLIAAATLGFLASIPVSWLVAKRLSGD